MTDHPGPSITNDSAPPSISAGASARTMGDYLLVTQLGTDAVGSVYRALHAGDGRFVRLRVLRSPELSPPAMISALRRELARASEPIERHRGLRISDGVPYLVWPASGGWTLDTVLARFRAGGWTMPVEFALSIAERASAEIERVRLSSGLDAPRFHGALWPGFIGLTSDAEVRVEGFGLSDAILPALSRSRMWRDVASYLPAETRQTGRADEKTDVYSIGVLLLELLTGRRASADMPPARWRADDEFSQEVSLMLRFALGHNNERFGSVAELRSALRELIAACPFEPSPADLALFLYDLLNPESRSLPVPFDGNSTNPLSPEHEVFPISPAVLKPETDMPAPKTPEQTVIPSGAILSGPAALRFVSRMRWAARAAAVAAALVGLFFASSSTRRRPSDTRIRVPGFGVVTPSAVPSPLWGIGFQNAAILSSPALLQPSVPMILERAAEPRSGSSAVRKDVKLRSSAETLRLKAALARVAAERLDAAIHAPTVLQEGRSFERQGEKLLDRGRFGAARDAYTRALDLFTKAESLSREERVRTIRIAGTATTS